MSLLLREVVEASSAIAATRSRNAKREIIADVLRRTARDELEVVVGLLAGRPRQGKVGIGWSTASSGTSDRSENPTLTVADVDGFLDRYPTVTGSGSQQRRIAMLDELVSSATDSEADYLRRLFIGDLRQGALEGVVVEGVATAFDVDPGLVRRAAMLSGELGRAAQAASEGPAALEAIGMSPLTAIQPMLAASAADVAEAMLERGRVAIEWKLDGTRIQAHRVGDEVRLFTRNLNDVTDRLPGIVAAVHALDCESVILDGESLGVDDEGRPRPFEQTMSEFGSDASGDILLRPFWFDLLHLDGSDLIDLPLSERRSALAELVPESDLIPQLVTDDVAEAEVFLADARATLHEGVMVKELDSPYEAGRRGSSWIKVKPVYTLDLVILAAEWGSGRRQGWLSNLHLGARDPDEGGFVMLGKTFKGLTDKMLEYQTETLLALEERRTARTVWVRPELVVEVAFDGLLPSTRYPGGMALRFARVRAHRPDKDAADADTIETVRAIFDRRTTR